MSQIRKRWAGLMASLLLGAGLLGGGSAAFAAASVEPAPVVASSGSGAAATTTAAAEAAPPAPALLGHQAALELDAAGTGWLGVSTALVLLMTLPGLALFYGGMVRRKNVIATITHLRFSVPATVVMSRLAATANSPLIEIACPV